VILLYWGMLQFVALELFLLYMKDAYPKPKRNTGTVTTKAADVPVLESDALASFTSLTSTGTPEPEESAVMSEHRVRPTAKDQGPGGGEGDDGPRQRVSFASELPRLKRPDLRIDVGHVGSRGVTHSDSNDGDEEDVDDDYDDTNEHMDLFGPSVQRVVRAYGLIICMSLYTIMALRTPSLISFTFVLIVFAGAVKPTKVFGTFTPSIIYYTALVLIAQYVYLLVLESMPSTETEPEWRTLLREVGFEETGWGLAVAAVIIALLVACWTVRKSSRLGVHLKASSQTFIFWFHRYMRTDGAKHLSLLLVFVLAVISVDPFHTPFIVIFVVFVAGPSEVSKNLWWILVVWNMFFILVEYVWTFSWLDFARENADYFFGLFVTEDDAAKSDNLWQDLSLPLFLVAVSVYVLPFLSLFLPLFLPSSSFVPSSANFRPSVLS
jgi:hypothetical protein